MPSTVIVALIGAAGILGKAALDTYQRTRVAKVTSKAQIIVASLAVLSATIAATPKAIDAYRSLRNPNA